MLEIQAVQAGFGRHLQFLPRDQVLTIKRLSQYNILLANIALWAVKISVCCFLLSLVQVAHQRTRWIIFGLIAITTVASTTQGILWGLQARPLEKLWNPDIPGEVSDIKTLVLSIIAFTSETFQSFARLSSFANNCTDLLRSKVVNSITDLFYALSPVYFIGRLRLSLGKRLIIIALTGSGLLYALYNNRRGSSRSDRRQQHTEYLLRQSLELVSTVIFTSQTPHGPSTKFISAPSSSAIWRRSSLTYPPASLCFAPCTKRPSKACRRGNRSSRLWRAVTFEAARVSEAQTRLVANTIHSLLMTRFPCKVGLTCLVMTRSSTCRRALISSLTALGRKTRRNWPRTQRGQWHETENVRFFFSF